MLWIVQMTWGGGQITFWESSNSPKKLIIHSLHAKLQNRLDRIMKHDKTPSFRGKIMVQETLGEAIAVLLPLPLD